MFFTIHVFLFAYRKLGSPLYGFGVRVQHATPLNPKYCNERVAVAGYVSWATPVLFPVKSD